MGAAFGCCAVQQPQRWLHLTCLSLLRALVLVCSMNWKRHDELETEGEGEGGEGGKESVWRQSHGQSHIKGSINTESPSTIHPSASAAHPVSGSASGPPVVAHTHQQRTQQSREQGEGSASSAATAGVAGGGGCAWTTTACCATRIEGHSKKQCEVSPCSRCATSTSWKEESAHGSV